MKDGPKKRLTRWLGGPAAGASITTAVAESLHWPVTPALQITGAVAFLVLWEWAVWADARDEDRRAAGLAHPAE